MIRFASASFSLMLCQFCLGGLSGIVAVEWTSTAYAQSQAAAERPTMDLQKSWGTICFHGGFPCSLILNLGSQTDMIAARVLQKEYGRVDYAEDGQVYSTFHDDQMECLRENGTIAFHGHLRNRQGAVSTHQAAYRLTWTVSDLGYIRLDARLKSQGGEFPGTVSYRFAFNGANLGRYYHTGFQPASVRRDTSLKHIPLEKQRKDRTHPFQRGDADSFPRGFG